MRSIIINPYDRTISEIDHDGDLRTMYETIKCDGVGMVRVNRRADGSGDVLWLDDDGLLIEGKPIFIWEGYKHPLAGIGLIMGVNDEGENAPAGIALNSVREQVRWTELETTGEMAGPGAFEPPPGVDFAFTTGSPILRKRKTEGAT